MIKDYEKTVELIVSYMKQQAKEANTDKAEIDVSGGIDSAVVAALTCRAFGPENVIGVYSSIHSSKESNEMARRVAEQFGFKLVELNLNTIFQGIVLKVKREFDRLGIPWPDETENPTVFGSLRSCIRAPIGRFVNRAFMGGIRQGTGNRDEDELIRFYQKGGDGEVDCNWIAGLFKSEVWELAEYLGVPKEVIELKPTPDLWGTGNAHNDEDELEAWTGVPLTYTRPGKPMGSIEWASRENEKNGIITGVKADVDPSIMGYDDKETKVILALRKMERITRHKAELPPSIPRSLLKSEGCVE
jgi:NAD+ synthetase